MTSIILNRLFRTKGQLLNWLKPGRERKNKQKRDLKRRRRKDLRRSQNFRRNLRDFS